MLYEGRLKQHNFNVINNLALNDFDCEHDESCLVVLS
jgi:hypothetical protein